jgi:hypothetical protein
MRMTFFLLAAFLGSVVASAEVPAAALRAVSDAAEALASDDASGFLDQFDRNMPDFAILRANAEALMGSSEVISTVEPISNEGNDQKQSVDLDWLLAINEKDGSGIRKETRRGVVKCRLERQGKRWKIVALEPVDFFRP